MNPSAKGSSAPSAHVQIIRVAPDGLSSISDSVATEEPLEIRVNYENPSGVRVAKTVSLTMRTPGSDAELAVGFLFGERIIKGRADLDEVPTTIADTALGNSIEVRLRPGVALNLRSLERHFYTTSSCGVCGKTSIEALQIGGEEPCPPDRPVLRREVITELPETLRRSQSVFEQTGGLHAAALFASDGRLLALREDVGRHNAVDKLIGSQLLGPAASLAEAVLVLSGRVSFELMQKAIAAGLPAVISVGAPSSLAVEVARKFGVTLIGFVRAGRMNVYTGAQRLAEVRDGSA